jgi:hypothetical protein
MPISPRRIVPDVLLMTALKIGNPVEAFIQVIIHDFARSTCRVRLRGVQGRYEHIGYELQCLVCLTSALPTDSL